MRGISPSSYGQLRPLKSKNWVLTQQMLAELAKIRIVFSLIGRCDPGKSLPVLLRHCLSLDGKNVGFNVHSGFNDSLEGLIIVDVGNTDRKTLALAWK